MGAVGNIPRSKIRQYLIDEWDLSGDQLHRATAILRRTDDAYIGMINSPNGSDGEPEMAESVKATDTDGVKRLMRGLGNRFKQTRKPKIK